MVVCHPRRDSLARGSKHPQLLGLAPFPRTFVFLSPRACPCVSKVVPNWPRLFLPVTTCLMAFAFMLQFSALILALCAASTSAFAPLRAPVSRVPPVRIWAFPGMAGARDWHSSLNFFFVVFPLRLPQAPVFVKTVNRLLQLQINQQSRASHPGNARFGCPASTIAHCPPFWFIPGCPFAGQRGPQGRRPQGGGCHARGELHPLFL